MALIISGGILAVLLLLLLMPIRVKFSYDTQSELPLQLIVYYAFLRFRVSPPPPKKPKPAPKKKAEEAPAEADREKAPGYIKRRIDEAGLFGFIGELADMLRILPHALYLALRHLKVKKLRLMVRIGGEDCADAAIKTGAAYAGIYPLLGAFAAIAKVYRPQIDIAPDYERDTDSESEADFSVSAAMRISPIFLIRAALWFLFKYIGIAKKSRPPVKAAAGQQ